MELGARHKSERGSAALEGALVMLPLLAIGFALMDFAVGIFIQNVLRHAVREGTRFAITQQTGPSGQDAAIKAAVQQQSMGFIQNTSYISVSYYDKTLAPATGVGSNAGGNICVVSVTGYPWTWFAPIYRSNQQFSFSASSSDMMESPPNGTPPGR